MSDSLKMKYFGKMSKDYKSMVNNQEFSDITLTVNGIIYYAHKNILASRSPVFAQMFRSNMNETQTNNVVIDDWECEVFERFLDHLYTGDVANLKQYALELFEMADKYQIISLKTFCIYSIEFDDQNVINILKMAHFSDTCLLKQRAVDYIVANLREIRPTFVFQELYIKHASLVNEIFAAIENKLFGSKRGENLVLSVNHSDAFKWFYWDPQGEIQGPFTPHEMYDWFTAGYFEMDLLVRRGCDEMFSQLGELFKLWDRIPFLPVQGSTPPPLRSTSSSSSSHSTLPVSMC